MCDSCEREKMKQVNDRKGKYPNAFFFFFTEFRLLNQENFMLVQKLTEGKKFKPQSLEMWNVKLIPKNGVTKLQCFWTWLNYYFIWLFFRVLAMWLLKVRVGGLM